MTDEEFLSRRRRLAEWATKRAIERGEPIEEVVAPFTNDDVPEFLKKLDEFERASRKSNLGPVCNYEFKYQAA